MKLTTTTQVSVDGVMQAPGGPDENRKGGFERGGWAHFDNEAATFAGQIYQYADAFLFGRRTYEHFAGTWGTWPDPGDSPIWEALNTQPKYVASTTLTEPRWANTTVLSGDLAEAIRDLKAKPAGELQVHGSGVLTRWLNNDLSAAKTEFTLLNKRKVSSSLDRLKREAEQAQQVWYDMREADTRFVQSNVRDGESVTDLNSQ